MKENDNIIGNNHVIKTSKTRSITFRLETNTIEELQTEAEYRETSLTTYKSNIAPLFKLGKV